VGVIDLFLPAEIEFVTSIEQDLHEPLREKAVDHLTVRILYPTEDERVIPVPQLEAENSKAFCEESMRYAAPPPLRSFAWILHTWRLARIPATRNAQPADRESPIIAFSHGLGGNADIYTYQTISLAAKGYTVIMVEHSDGSAPVVSRQDASKIRRNVTVEVVRIVEEERSK
jgi:platelet-activating factor acetylhydrolase